MKAKANGSDNTLEQRCLQAITSAADSDQIEALLAELDEGIDQAKAHIGRLREEIYDPIKMPDIREGRLLLEDMEFLHGRLLTLKPKLESKRGALAEEERSKDYELLVDGLTKELVEIEDKASKTYAECVAKIHEAFCKVREFEAQQRHKASNPPPGVNTLRQFSDELKRVMEQIKLFDWKGEQLWPPYHSWAADFVRSMPIASHVGGISGPIGPNWESPELQKQFKERREEEFKRQAAFLEQQTKQQEQRENEELKKSFAASQRRV
jgi:hypothetical protein